MGIKVVELNGCCRKVNGNIKLSWVKGKAYYIKGLVKEGGGGEYLDIGMKVGNGEYYPIPISMFASVTGPYKKPACNTQLKNGNFDIDTPAARGYTYRTPSSWSASKGGVVVVKSRNGPWGGLSSASGRNFLSIQTDGSFVEQSICGLSAGKDYQLTFSMTHRPGYGNDEKAVVKINGKTVWAADAKKGLPANFKTFVVKFRAAGNGIAKIRFENDSPRGDRSVFLDNVQLGDYTAPPPTGWKCQKYNTPNNQKYVHTTLTLGASKAVVFDVKAKNDAHIGFFSDKKSTKEVYEIVLSGWGNKQSVIRESNQGRNQVTKATVGLLSQNSVKSFWADAKNGLVRVGTGKKVGSNLLMQWKDPKPHDVKYVGLMTGWGATGQRNICSEGSGGGGPKAVKCATENQQCKCNGNVRYGHHNHQGKGEVWSKWKKSTGSIACTNAVFGDPAYGTVKYCECASATGGGCTPSRATAKCPSYCSNFKKSVAGTYASPVVTQTSFGSNGATFQLSVGLKGAARNLYSVHGSELGPLTLPPAYQSSKSPLIGGPNPLYGQKDDSFVTVGLPFVDKKQISATPNMPKWTSKAGFKSNNAAFFWMNPKNGPTTGKILVAQVTIAVPCTKLWSVTMGLTGYLKNGKVWRDDKVVFAWSKFKASMKRCPADVEFKRGPGKVNVEDLLVILAAFGKKCPQQVSCEVDVETKRSKGEINVEDLLAVLAAFGQKCGN